MDELETVNDIVGFKIHEWKPISTKRKGSGNKTTTTKVIIIKVVSVEKY